MVTVGGVVKALTVTVRGVSRGGGGTGFIVALSTLEPSAVYEYVLEVR